ncbi:hypothetical protein MRB53_037529 [Persea americana]|nr:hypothetical protein MRB53_037529 [Persea americana]
MAAQPHASSRSPLPILPVITLLSTPASTAYNHALPVLVLAIYYASFNALVADPVSTLFYLAWPLAAFQAIFCVLCLPVSTRTSTSNTTSKSQSLSQSAAKSITARAKRGSAQPTLASKLAAALLSLTLTLSLSLPLLTILVILHGAPLTTHQPHTLLFGAHLALLTTPPLFYIHGIDSTAWRSLVSLSFAFDTVTGRAVGALVGAWLGAIPIPLDWDREWQAWPVTVVLGCVGGWALGGVVGATVGKEGVLSWEGIAADNIERPADSGDGDAGGIDLDMGTRGQKKVE